MQMIARSPEADVEVSVVLPCLNEERTVGRCVAKARSACAAAGIEAEVIVADNGSSDRSRELAAEAGARVVAVPVRGYGAALRAGIDAARGRFVVMADSDDSYALEDVPAFVTELRGGAELVMGSRFRGTIHPGAMPFLHRYLGNPVLTFILNVLFGAGISDAHCGMRGFSKEAIAGLGLRTSGMEFASEMVIRSAQERLRIREVPTSLRPDGRGRAPHLRTWRDGWRHLRFMLLFSPLWLFAVPGLSAAVLGFALTTSVAFTNLTVWGHRFNTHFALLGSTLAVLGVQVLMLGAFAKTIFILDGVGQDPRVRKIVEGFRLEVALVGGLLLFAIGVGIDGSILWRWLQLRGGALDADTTHLVILGGTMAAVGVELVFGAFFLSVLYASRSGRWV
jgi:hypothetical protein